MYQNKHLIYAEATWLVLAFFSPSLVIYTVANRCQEF